MKIKFHTVNEKGMEEIRIFLEATHERGKHFNRGEIQVMAFHAETLADRGKSPIVEVPYYYSLTRRTVTLTISKEGMNEKELEVNREIGRYN